MSLNTRVIRLPAEWEPHSATWLSWPHSAGCSFPGETIQRILPAMREIVSSLARSEDVYVNVRNEGETAQLLDGLDERLRPRVVAVSIATNEPWCRDHGPIIVECGVGKPEALATCWKFAAWGGKYEPFDDDARASTSMADYAGVASVAIPHVLEGGMIDTDGRGTALVSRLAMLDPKRNPGLDEKAAEGLLRQYLGIERVVWLDAQVAGDDTDGHVDTYVRFVADRRVALCLDPGGGDYRRVKAALREQISGVEIIDLPPPEPFVIHGDEVPASYANFYLANTAAIVPVFDQPGDQRAVDILSSLFPDREIIPVDCREMIWGLGAIHCLSCPVPAVVGRRDLPT